MQLIMIENVLINPAQIAFAAKTADALTLHFAVPQSEKSDATMHPPGERHPDTVTGHMQFRVRGAVAADALWAALGEQARRVTYATGEDAAAR